MEADQITEQKVIVLQYFIEIESMVMAGFTPDKGISYPDPETGKPRYYSYPKRIEDDLKARPLSISRTWAAKVCKQLEALGILGHRMIRPARQKNSTEHYYLKHGVTPFIAVMQVIFENPPTSRAYISLSYEYIRQHINEDLVREILTEKKAVMGRYITLLDWSPAESGKVHEILMSEKKLFEYPLGKSVSSDPEVPAYESYISNLVKGVNGQQRTSFSSFSSGLHLRFPVLKAGMPDDEKKQAFISENAETLKRFPGIDRYQSAIKEHYMKYQRDSWILPILALIRSSRNALKEFLFGDWKPYERASGPTSMDYPIFSFLFTAVYDIATTRYVMDESTIPLFRFRPDFRHSPSAPTNPALLEIGTNLNLKVCYDASFDTEHLFYGAENGDVWENDREQNYDVRTWIEIQALGVKLKKEDVPDFLRFVTSLKDLSNAVSRRIVERLSHRVQHFILFSHPQEKEFPVWGESLLTELDRIFSEPGFYDSHIFPQISLTEEGRNLVERNGYFGRRDSDTFFHFTIFCLNRILFEESYPDLVKRSDYLKSDREKWIAGTVRS